jgi:hypothetical protein
VRDARAPGRARRVRLDPPALPPDELVISWEEDGLAPADVLGRWERFAAAL